MSLAVSYALVTLLLADSILIVTAALHGAPQKAWLGVVGYVLISLALMFRRAPHPSGSSSGGNLRAWLSRVFCWKHVAYAGGVGVLFGQVLIIGAGKFVKPGGAGFESIIMQGLVLTGLSLLMTLPHLMGFKGGVRVTPKLLKWSVIIIFAAGFAGWTAAFIRSASFDFGDCRMYSLFDDAMISLRYALNLTQGHGLVWNIGERVEGYTNLLMVLVMSVGTFFFSPNGAVLYTHIVGAGFILVIAFCMRSIAGRIMDHIPEERRNIYEAVAFLLPFLYYPLVYWSVMGMETGLLSMLVTAAVCIAIRPVKTARFNPWLPVLLGLMVLVRPDASVQAGLILLFRFIAIIPQRGAFRVILTEGVVFCVLPVAQLLFRHGYYHEWLPNTYTLKMVGLDTKIRIQGGWGFMKLFLQSVWPALALGTLGTFWKFRKEKALLLALMLSVMAYQVYVGGDPWPYWRIMAPYLPMLLFLNLALLESLFSLLIRPCVQPQARFWNSGAILCLTVTLLLGVVAWSDRQFAKEMFFVEKPYTADFNGAHIRIGRNLKAACKPDATVGVFWAGTIPYVSGLRGIDFLGKCDRTIARLDPDPRLGGHGMISVPGHNKYDLKYSIRELKPDYIQNYYWAGNDETEYAREHYIMKNNMLFKKDSDKIYWDRLPEQ